MSYTFKVGDKGKTRSGRDYEVLAVDTRLAASVVALIIGSTGGAYTEQRWIDGRNVIGKDTAADLLPPTRTVYVNFYEDGSCFYYNDELTAKIQVPFDERHRIATAVPVEIVG